MGKAELVLRHDGLSTRAGAFRMTPTGLAVEGRPSFAEWQRYGEFIQQAARGIQWCLGDWLNYGEAEWGEMYAQAMEATGLDYQTLANAKYVAGRFDFSRRREKLPFAAHAETASLCPAEADALLGRAESEGLSSREVRVLARRARAVAALPAAEPDATCRRLASLRDAVAAGERFGCIYADPPWPYGNQGTRAATDNHYRTMSVEDIAALPVGALAAERSHLHLWTTNGFLETALSLVRGWGFEFKSTFVWVKPQLGIGNYWRCSHEILLLGVKGGLTYPSNGVPSWLEADRTSHSAKPEKVRELVEQLSPGPRLELFARRTSPGWSVWGDQVGRVSLFDPELVGETA